jgi:hypothetical protein
VQAAVGAGHHLLDLGTGAPRWGAGSSSCRGASGQAHPAAQGTPHVEKTDQEEDEQGEVAHGRGSSGFRV